MWGKVVFPGEYIIFITSLTNLDHVYSLEPPHNFMWGKVVFPGVYIIFKTFLKNIDYVYSLEPKNTSFTAKKDILH